ncbi:MAG: hypothetical protein AAGD25_06835 [Cyanobacteria bacterium P01_F01_bin.150]
MQKKPRKHPVPNPHLEELKRLNKTLGNIEQDLEQINKRLNKPIDLVDQIAKGVVLAGVAWAILIVLLQIIFG